MDVQYLKRWHWIVIGIIVGGILGYVQTNIPVKPGLTTRDGLGAQEFDDLIHNRAPQQQGGLLAFLRTSPHAKKPRLADLVVYPPIDGKNYVIGRYRPNRDVERWSDFEFSASIPFKVPGQAQPRTPAYTICDYLEEQAQKQPELTYRYLWWKSPTVGLAMWWGGAVLVIGGALPSVIGVMIGAGWGRKREPKGPEYDLDRFGKEPDPATAPARPARDLSDQDQDHLRRLEEEMQKSLSANGGGEASAPATDTAHPAAVKQLSSGPLETLASDADEESKEYKGEYYPVARGATGKTEEKRDHS